MGNPFSNPAVEDLGLTVLRNVTDWIFHVQPDADPYAVQDTYNQQRDGVRSRAAGLGFQGEFRPRKFSMRTSSKGTMLPRCAARSTRSICRR